MGSTAPAWLVGDWGRWVRDPADLVRLSFLLGAVVTFAVGLPEQALRLFLTFLVSLVPRLLAVPRPFDLAFGAGMSLQAWGNVARAFQSQGYDKVVHFALPCAVAMLAYIGLIRARVVPDLSSERGIHRWAGIVLMAFAIGFAVSGVYEMYEWLADNLLGAHLHVGYGDSIGDLADNSLGALVGGALLVVWDVRGWATHRRVPASQLGVARARRGRPTHEAPQRRPPRPGVGVVHLDRRARAAPQPHAPRWLGGDWTALVRDPVDLIRLSFVVGMVGAAARGRADEAIRFGLSLGAALAARALDAPRLFDLAFCAGMALEAWGDAAGAFRRVTGYAAAAHVVVSLAFAGLLYLALVRARVLPEFADERGIHRRVAIFVTAACLGFGVGILYELYVWVATHAFGAGYHVTYGELIGRLGLDLVGAAAGALVIVLWDVYGWGTRRRIPGRALRAR